MKLEIELVPKSSWYSNVRSNISKEEWDILRKASYRKAGHLCEICGGKGDKHPVECHEIWEYDDNRNIQKLIGFIALCPDCHQIKHIGLARIKGNFEKAKKHLMKINKISEEKADEYIEEVFEKWVKRSKEEWNIDLKFLNNLTTKK